ncbi:hypothetical protein [Phytohalomonas tamaricis]|uniref:hypothetical protein n=1 Tax=Phytohalomonas tamaricis TaxID=2081032 RepID=UPI000D0AEB1A|nr:hypothetical protein [Phytohalomonas tamaricis]
MDLLSWIVTGMVVGALVNLIMPARIAVGYLGSIGISTLGAVIITFAISVAKLIPEGEFSLAGVAVAVAGALVAQVLLIAFRLIART